jgi:hypothetical protein
MERTFQKIVPSASTANFDGISLTSGINRRNRDYLGMALSIRDQLIGKITANFGEQPF